MSVRTAWAGPRSAARSWADRNTCGYVRLRKKAAARAEELKNMGFAQEDLEDHPSIRTLVQEDEEEKQNKTNIEAAAGYSVFYLSL